MAIVCHEVMRHGIRVLTGFRRNAHLSGSKDDRLRPADCKSLAGALFKMRALPCRLADGPPRIPAACIPARPTALRERSRQRWRVGAWRWAGDGRVGMAPSDAASRLPGEIGRHPGSRSHGRAASDHEAFSSSSRRSRLGSCRHLGGLPPPFVMGLACAERSGSQQYPP